MRIPLILATALGLMAASTGKAHHSAAMFDATKCATVQGTVRTFEWQFPHSWLWLVVPDKKKGTVVWGFEMPAPTQLMRIDPRWNRRILPKGMKVEVKFAPLRDGRTGGLMNSVRSLGSTNLLIKGAPNAFRCEDLTFGASEATRREAAARGKGS